MTAALINSNCKLNSLQLAKTEITDEAVKHLSAALINSNCKLNSLGLANNKITVEGVNHLTRALTNKNCKLKSLSLPKGAVSKKIKILINDIAKYKNCAVFYLDSTQYWYYLRK